MQPPTEASSPKYRNVEPTIFDSDMENPLDKGDFGFDPSFLGSSTPDASRQLEDLFLSPASTTRPSDSNSCLSPSDLTLNGNSKESSAVTEPTPSYRSDTQSNSPADSSHGSSADSPMGHLRNPSVHSNSEIFSPGSVGGDRFLPNGWSNAEDISAVHDDFFSQDNGASFLKGDFAVDGDIEMSNKAMASAFDFESAASSPSPLKMDTNTVAKTEPPPSQCSPAERKAAGHGSSTNGQQVRVNPNARPFLLTFTNTFDRCSTLRTPPSCFKTRCHHHTHRTKSSMPRHFGLLSRPRPSTSKKGPQPLTLYTPRCLRP